MSSPEPPGEDTISTTTLPTTMSPPQPHPTDKSATFRQRRLSLTKHHLEFNEEDHHHHEAESSREEKEEEPQNPYEKHDMSGTPDDENDKAHTFRKRRLSLTLLAQPPAAEAASPPQTMEEEGRGDHSTSSSVEPPIKRRRRSSVASAASGASSVTTTTGGNHSSNHNNKTEHKSQTLHSTELLGGPMPPPSPAGAIPQNANKNNILYQQQPAPPPPPELSLNPAAFITANTMSQQQQFKFLNPKWKKRHQPTDKSMFPFPLEIVGTYSCHGVEPIYDSEYEQSPEDYDEDEDDEDYVNDDEDNASHGEEETNHASGVQEAAAAGANNDDHDGVDTSENNATMTPTKHTMMAKINQDRGGIAYPYGNNAKTALFAVYDGHGQGGELVSQYALHEVQRRLERNAHFATDLSRAFQETFQAVDESLKHEPIIEPYYAGTTAVVALLQDQQLTLANAGDSRAVLARRTGTTTTMTTAAAAASSSLVAIDLTEDQNPDSPLERARIEQMGGFVSDSPGPGLSARVWLDPDLTQVGLAMARSIGDHAIAEVGVIAEPVVSTYRLQEQDEFIILASDGVWEFLSSQDAVNIVGEHLEERGATKACQALIEAAAHRWHDEEGAYRDDITCIVVRLPGLWNKLTPSTS